MMYVYVDKIRNRRTKSRLTREPLISFSSIFFFYLSSCHRSFLLLLLFDASKKLIPLTEEQFFRSFSQFGSCLFSPERENNLFGNHMRTIQVIKSIQAEETHQGHIFSICL